MLELILLIVISFLRGSPGFEKCSAGDWILMVVFIVLMICFVVVGVKLVFSE